MIRPHGTSVAAALLADALFGEVPGAAHPIVIMGRAISAFEGRALALKDARRLRLAGLFLAVALPALSFILACIALRLAPPRLRWPFEVGLLSTTLSMRGLARSALAVERELEGGDLEAAGARAGELVGRDTERLPPGEVARASVESVAENTSDGVVAPMMYGLLLGAPGALAYKAVNTLDSMVGHRQPPYKDLGWVPARLDDLANLLPARLTALSVAIVSDRGLATLGSARRYGPLTRSPNAGRVEAAFAGALDLRLGGANSYGGVLRQGPVLGSGHPPEAGDIRRAVSLMRRSCLLLAALFLAAQRVAGGRHSG
ncbi:MAG TPA: adenosylcobinamide-phosphate synthase CbiB [Rubrobacteraceae bacterium]|nr:adenosylcobinamide-phosphate synthase CbiB [Rubrobacteraceae bacterium]